MSRSNLRSTILGFTLLSCLLSIDPAYGFNEERIKVESNFIFVKYDHELKGESTGFHQRIDISSFDQNATKKYVDGDEFNLNWADFATLRIKKKDDKCEDYELTSKRDEPLRVRFDTSNVFLYGGPEQDYQGWPVDYNKYDQYSYVSKEKDSQAVLESFWLVTNGMYLHVDEKTPLFITQDKSKGIFELIASREPPYIRNGGVTEMKYTICKLDNMKEAHKHAVSTKVIGKPSGLPDTKAVKYPIWSTWAMYLSKIDNQVVLDYADLITQSKLPNSQLEIDDKWETCYGSLTVNRTTFPDMKDLVARLHAKNFGVTMWVHPFVNTNCEPYFTEGVEKEYFVKNTAGSVVSNWWNGEGAYIDFTKPEATAWWQNRLKKLLAETGLDGYKFDAGESSWAPQPSVFHAMDENHPETNLKAYIKACAEFGTNIEVRSGRGTQKYPIFVRMIDRETNWDSRLGLQTLIPTLLQMNILGYPFVLPDMVGGNGYGDKKPSDELFIRWLQANVFMPSIQFSFPPSMFSVEVQRLTTKFVNMHVKYSNKIIEAMENSVKYGTPVNPPLWWLDPTDPTTFHIDSEFLLGEDILIAPVLEKGARSRDIYLPKGYWKDEVNENAEIIKGPTWLYNYPADLGTLPFFTKVNAPESHTESGEKKNSGVSLMPAFTSILVAIILTKFYSWCFCN